ncbi:NAD-dependent epimerase/dehydratase family protein [Yoonia sediminilitoris]|uniref:Nucleoside-diphosphate-sugar epimerase n=1 Tax=Yoonia sediminilitoris TaxID=1286148 RepID=A0A2T6KBV8_9RHOB|nr:NAD-dependent epimerase/dehydratase family protein [Yoonia sediminilitoris]PUB12394.1 nucleoside-diphosphate-sugar epimerase [Yoonia sediminilitoris]RCW93088.1 nucleoside-diphosphate-sugar epimerase [Yoonia sediminilitoris]
MGYHAVLGGGGAIGRATLKAIEAKGLNGRALTRADADAMDPEALVRVLDGAEVVYDCVGLPYNSDLWTTGFPAISKALVTACEKTGTKIVYFDNVYLYGPAPLPVPFAETTSRIPPSRKGRARKTAVEIVTQAHQAGRVRATVGRAADFYGPGAVNSPFYIRFLENMLKGKSPQVAMPKGPVHTYAYTDDMGRALVDLALFDAAYGEEFHLPVGPAVKVSDMAALFNRELGTSLKTTHIPDIVLRGLSLFKPLIREIQEMSYQYKTDYIMSDAKFRQRFPEFTSTSYEDGVAAMVDHFRTGN